VIHPIQSKHLLPLFYGDFQKKGQQDSDQESAHKHQRPGHGHRPEQEAHLDDFRILRNENDHEYDQNADERFSHLIFHPAPPDCGGPFFPEPPEFPAGLFALAGPDAITALRPK
jgi:hypothetical protein